MREGDVYGAVAIPAAQYVRTSTPSQDTSADTQRLAIANYAAKHGFSVVQTYQDIGKSGLLVRGRLGLRTLLGDVIGGAAKYKAILIYDVSRWGRFQYPDEAAHYEFLCKRVGLEVHYCADPFTNDGRLQSTILKALRRGMAAEYSRELSAKVIKGQQHLIRCGFRMGAAPGYGLRRQLLSPDGKHKKVLRAGEYKSVATERVVLIPGPPEEVSCVKLMFKHVLSGKSLTWIAGALNRQRIAWQDGTAWNPERVSKVVHNPKYAGCYVWGRCSRRLDPESASAKDVFVIPNTFPAIVPRMVFDAAQRKLKVKSRYKSDRALLRKLKILLKKKGRLSEAIIATDPGVPSLTAYLNRFGSLRKIYELIGYETNPLFCARADLARRTRALRIAVIDRIVDLFHGSVEIVPPSPRTRRSLIRFDDGTILSVVICRTRRTRQGKLRWALDVVDRERRYRTLLCMLDESNRRICDLYVCRDIPFSGQRKLTKHSAFLCDALRLSRLEQLGRQALDTP